MTAGWPDGSWDSQCDSARLAVPCDRSGVGSTCSRDVITSGKSTSYQSVAAGWVYANHPTVQAGAQVGTTASGFCRVNRATI